MSINIGYLGTNYGINNIASIDNRLNINTYYTSNAININTNINSTSNSVINYKNLFKTGVIDNNYVIQNYNNDNAIILTNSNIFINKNIIFNNDIDLQSILNISNNTLQMTSNIYMQLYDNNNFNIYNKNNSDLNFSFNNSNFTSYIDNFLYKINTNEIKPADYNNNINSSIKIYNADLIDVKIESFNATRFSINNIKENSFVGESFIINRYYNLYNILEINTCNFNVNNSSNTYYNEPIFKHFVLNNNGMVGIGSKPPDAPLSISANYYDNPYIFKYTGTYLSDTFNISKDANIGIGTTKPLGILHINRNDDKYDDLTNNLSYNNIRNLPLLKLNIDYDINKNNITTSNTEIIINNTNIVAKNIYNYIYTPSINSINNVNTSQLNNFIYILNNELFSELNNDIKNLASISNNNSCNINYKTYTLKNYLKDNTFTGLDVSADTGVLLIYKNNICYPENIFISDYMSDYYYQSTNNIEIGSLNTYKYKSINNYKHGIILMSKDTYDTGSYLSITDINNYSKVTSNFNISTLTSSKNIINNGITSNILYYQDVNFELNIYIEKNKTLKTNYNTSNLLISSPPPDFLYLTSNNEFKASISHNGILSLGNKYTLNDNNYILYIPENTAYINNAELNSITTQNDSIIFNNKNISDINNINSISANISNCDFLTVNISNLYTSNLSIIDNLIIENVIMNSNNVHLTNKLSISKDPLDDNSILNDNSALMKLTVNSNIIIDNIYFKNSDAVVITNNNISTTLSSNINPSISIYGKDGSYPLIKLSKNKIRESSFDVENTLNNYFIRLATKTYNYGGTSFLDHFEICCDNIDNNKIDYYNNINNIRQNTNILPSFIKHVKNYNLLCFGELNNICINCDNNFSKIFNPVTVTQPTNETFTNSTNKISIGLPYKDTLLLSDNLQNTIEDWPQIFNNKICNLPSDNDNAYNKYNSNMLNIFGNTNIWSISGNNILKANMIVDNQYVEKGCDITIGSSNYILSSNTNLNVYGGIRTEYPIKTFSGSNIMNNINTQAYVNPLDKILNINGYSYTRNGSSEIEFGLNAEEVEAQFPDLVSRYNNNPTINYGGMIAVLIEAVKELKRSLDTVISI